MQLQIDNLGKVSITVEKDYWDINKDYDKLVVVQNGQGEEIQRTFNTYLSRKPVPAGITLDNREYWIPFSSLKEDIVLDYDAFKVKYGKEIADIKQHISVVDEQIAELYETKDAADEAVRLASKAIKDSQDAIDTANETIAEAQEIVKINDDLVKNFNDRIGSNTQQIEELETAVTNHTTDKNNPHRVTAEQVGLGSYSAYNPTTLPVSNPTSEAINSAKSELNANINNVNANLTLTIGTAVKQSKAYTDAAKAELTTNMNSAISAAKTEVKNYTDNQVNLLESDIEGKVSKDALGVTVATLENNKVPASQLPSYVDDIIDVYAKYTVAANGALTIQGLYLDAAYQTSVVGEAGKIYQNVNTAAGFNVPYQFRWTGSKFAQTGASTLIIGTISGTAYDGASGQKNATDISILKGTVQAHDASIVMINESLTDHNDRISANANKIASIESDISDINDAIQTDINVTLGNHEARLGQVEQKAAGNTTEITTLKNKTSNLETTLGTVTEWSGDVQTAIDGISASNAMLSQDLTDLEGTVKTQGTTIDNHNTRIQSNASAITTLQNRTTNTEAAIGTINGILDTATQQIVTNAENINLLVSKTSSIDEGVRIQSNIDEYDDHFEIGDGGTEVMSTVTLGRGSNIGKLLKINGTTSGFNFEHTEYVSPENVTVYASIGNDVAISKTDTGYQFGTKLPIKIGNAASIGRSVYLAEEVCINLPYLQIRGLLDSNTNGYLEIFGTVFPQEKRIYAKLYDGISIGKDFGVEVNKTEHTDTNGDVSTECSFEFSANVPFETVNIGGQTYIGRNNYTGNNVNIGNDVIITSNIYLGGDTSNVYIGTNNVYDNPTNVGDVFIGTKINIGSNVTIGTGVSIGTNTSIYKGVSIGTNTSISNINQAGKCNLQGTVVIGRSTGGIVGVYIGQENKSPDYADVLIEPEVKLKKGATAGVYSSIGNHSHIPEGFNIENYTTPANEENDTPRKDYLYFYKNDIENDSLSVSHVIGTVNVLNVESTDEFTNLIKNSSISESSISNVTIESVLAKNISIKDSTNIEADAVELPCGLKATIEGTPITGSGGQPSISTNILKLNSNNALYNFSNTFKGFNSFENSSLSNTIVYNSYTNHLTQYGNAYIGDYKYVTKEDGTVEEVPINIAIGTNVGGNLSSKINSEDIIIGKGVYIADNVELKTSINISYDQTTNRGTLSVGENVEPILHPNIEFGQDIKLYSNITIGTTVNLSHNITIENGVTIGSNVNIGGGVDIYKSNTIGNESVNAINLDDNTAIAKGVSLFVKQVSGSNYLYVYFGGVEYKIPMEIA